MASYKKVNKSEKMKGHPSYRNFNLIMSRIFDEGKKFPHVKYINQIIKDLDRI